MKPCVVDYCRVLGQEAGYEHDILHMCRGSSRGIGKQSVSGCSSRAFLVFCVFVLLDTAGRFAGRFAGRGEVWQATDGDANLWDFSVVAGRVLSGWRLLVPPEI